MIIYPGWFTNLLPNVVISVDVWLVVRPLIWRKKSCLICESMEIATWEPYGRQDCCR
jgi:hypothetical protein